MPAPILVPTTACPTSPPTLDKTSRLTLSFIPYASRQAQVAPSPTRPPRHANVASASSPTRARTRLITTHSPLTSPSASPTRALWIASPNASPSRSKSASRSRAPAWGAGPALSRGAARAQAKGNARTPGIAIWCAKPIFLGLDFSRVDWPAPLPPSPSSRPSGTPTTEPTSLVYPPGLGLEARSVSLPSGGCIWNEAYSRSQSSSSGSLPSLFSRRSSLASASSVASSACSETIDAHTHRTIIVLHLTKQQRDREEKERDERALGMALLDAIEKEGNEWKGVLSVLCDELGEGDSVADGHSSELRSRNTSASERQASRSPIFRRPALLPAPELVVAPRRLRLRLSPAPASPELVKQQPTQSEEKIKRRARIEAQKKKINGKRQVDDLADLFGGKVDLAPREEPAHVTFYHAMMAQRALIIRREGERRLEEQQREVALRDGQQRACELLDAFHLREGEVEMGLTEDGGSASEEEVVTPPTSPACLTTF